MAKNKAKYDTDVTDTTLTTKDVATLQVSPDNEAAAPKEPKTPKLNYHVAMSVGGGELVPYLFAKRDWLKREHTGLPATICGEAGSVVVIEAREFADKRVWVKLPNGDKGRFLVPKDLDMTGELNVVIVEGALKYDREPLRVRPKQERKKKAEGEAVAPTPEDPNPAPEGAEAQ